MISPADRKQAVILIDEAHSSGARKSRACEVLEISVRTYYRWGNGGFDDGRQSRIQTPTNQLSNAERQAVIDCSNRPDNQSLSPKQESTSIIDAAACGLPIIISDRVLAKERVDGNGLTYIENDRVDLAAKILQMKDEKLRKELGLFGVNKIQNNFSWDKIAKERLIDYKSFVK